VSFEQLQLKPALIKAIKHCGYTTPTPIQQEAVPKILAGHDVIASAHTGTGKTASFVLPILQRLPARRRAKPGQPAALILTPTRELANQVTQAIRRYGKYLRFQAISLVGGMPYGPQLKSLSKPIDIVIATPGRLQDYIERGNVDLSRVETLVLDEADRMLDMGFIDEVNKIAEELPSERQTLLFTATWDDKLAALARKLLQEPQQVCIETEKTQKNIEQRLHIADNLEHKTRLLHHLIGDTSLKQAIIFSATKQGANTLAQALVAQGYAAAALHGDMKQAARNRTLMNLRHGKVRFLVATDVAARGIDITGVSHVINFDLPRFAEDYIHRIGRTGRAGASGTAISFVLPNDAPHLERIERYTGEAVPQHVIPGLEPTCTLQRRLAKKRKFRNDMPPSRKNYYTAAPKRRPHNSTHPSSYKRQGQLTAKKMTASKMTTS